jgi:hypothetical protein
MRDTCVTLQHPRVHRPAPPLAGSTGLAGSARGRDGAYRPGRCCRGRTRANFTARGGCHPKPCSRCLNDACASLAIHFSSQLHHVMHEKLVGPVPFTGWINYQLFAEIWAMQLWVARIFRMFSLNARGMSLRSEQLLVDAVGDVARPAAARWNLRICESANLRTAGVCGCMGVWAWGGVSFRTVMKFRETGI